jgi:hypothetical protein
MSATLGAAYGKTGAELVDVLRTVEYGVAYHASASANQELPTLVEWPTDEGIWMGNMGKPGAGEWFPLKTAPLRDDLPSPEEIAREKAGEVMPPRAILAIVAQWPKSETEWPFLFKGNHPVKEWRRPTPDELQRAKRFYRLEVTRAEEINGLHSMMTSEMSSRLVETLARTSGLSMSHYDNREKQIIGLLVHWGVFADLSKEVADELWRRAAKPSSP